MEASRLCRSLVSPSTLYGECDHLRLTDSVFHALCSFNHSAVRTLASAPSVSVDEEVGAEILRDSDEPLRTLFTSLSQLPGFPPPLLSVRSLYAGGEFLQCALDSNLPLSQLSSLSLHPLTGRSRLMRVRNRLWCSLHSLPQLTRLKVGRYTLSAVDHSVLFSLPLEHLDLSNSICSESAMESMAAVGVSRTLRSLLLETSGARMEKQEVGALMLNLSRTPLLRYVALSAVLFSSSMRLLSSVQQLTTIDLSGSAIVPAYLSFFVSSTGEPALPLLVHFSTAQSELVQHDRLKCEAHILRLCMLRFAHAYRQLHTCRLTAVSTELVNNVTVVAETLSEVRQVRLFGLRMVPTNETMERCQLEDSDQEDEQEEQSEEKIAGMGGAATATVTPSSVPQALSLSWLAQLDLDAVPLHDASLLLVLRGCTRLRQITCRNCEQQTTAAWLLAAMNAPHLISLVLYAEEVKATAAAWKKATDTFPSLAYLIDPLTSADSPSATSCSGYPGLAQLELRMLQDQQSDKAGFASLMRLMAAAPLTALNIHLPVNAVLGSRLLQLQAMSHMESLNIVTPQRAVQADTTEGEKHREVADKIQRLLNRCVHDRRLSQQHYAEWLTTSWDKEVLGDGQEGKEGDRMLSHHAAVNGLVQGDSYTQGRRNV